MCVSSAEGASILCGEIIRGWAQDLSIAMIHASAIAKGCTGRCGRVRGTVSERKQENERFGVACGRMHAHICSRTHTHTYAHMHGSETTNSYLGLLTSSRRALPRQKAEVLGKESLFFVCMLRDLPSSLPLFSCHTASPASVAPCRRSGPLLHTSGLMNIHRSSSSPFLRECASDLTSTNSSPKHLPKHGDNAHPNAVICQILKGEEKVLGLYV